MVRYFLRLIVKKLLLISLFCLTTCAFPVAGGVLEPFPNFNNWLVGNQDIHSFEPAEGHSGTIDYGLTLLFHEKSLLSEQQYKTRDINFLYSYRQNSLWGAINHTNNSATLFMDNIIDTDVMTLMKRKNQTTNLYAGYKHNDNISTQISIGTGRGLSYGADLLLNNKRGSILFSGSVKHPEWNWEQKIYNHRYYFEFPFRTESAEILVNHVNSLLPQIKLNKMICIGEPDMTATNWNILYSNIVSCELYWDSLIYGTQLLLKQSSSKTSIEMQSNGGIYLRLKDLEYLSQSARLTTPTLPGKLKLFGGYKQQKIYVDNAYFEPWAFSFLDIFANNRYLLDNFRYDLSIISLGIKRGYDNSGLLPINNFAFSVCHQWLDGDGNLQWKERVPVLPPFFFTWDRHSESLLSEIPNLIRVDMSISYPLNSRWTINSNITQIIPLLNYSSLTNPENEPSGDSDTVFKLSGFSGRLFLTFN